MKDRAGQTKNFECFLIDDISTDDSFEVAKNSINDDSRFFLVQNKEKSYALKNIADTINNGKFCFIWNEFL